MSSDPRSGLPPATRCLPAPQPVVPDYRGACLVGVVPGLLSGPGHRPSWFPEAARDAAQVVLFVVDGMGWEQLVTRAMTAPTLASMSGGPIHSVAPTTTATALTSITCGTVPADHGLVGYRFRIDGPQGDEVLNVLRWRSASGDAREYFAPQQAVRGVAFGGRPVPVVSKAEFAGTGFSVAHQRGSRSVGWSLPSSIVVEVRRLLAAGEPLIYVYYEGVDKIAHLSGLGELYAAEMRATDRIVADLLDCLPGGAALMVTADHGQVEVADRAVPVVADVMAHARLLSGEARFRWFHARPGQHRDLEDACRDTYGGQAWIRTVDQVADEGWFGGPLRPELLARLGDVVVLPYEPVGYLDPADTGDAQLICRHGSLTSAEVLVPLLAAGPTS
jgi:hypothetical protein